jgi:molybdopterin-guanine dinucleotide biosynthesis protein A
MSTNVRHAAIIAGGASRRMGRTKALLEVAGRPLIARVAEVVRAALPQLFVVTSSPEIAAAADAPAVPDIFPGQGPLAGIHAALRHAGAPVFCCACDMPHLNAAFIRFLCERLDDYDAVVPRAGVYDEPLHAIYAPACLPAIEAELQGRVGPVDNIFKGLRVLFVGADEARRFDAELRMFDNWNTPDEVKKSGVAEL